MTKILTAAVLVAATGAASAQMTLWEQLPDTSRPAQVDQDFGDFPDFATFIVDDVSFGTNVTIDSITTFFTDQNLSWPLGAGTATLNIFAKTGASPDNVLDDPTAGATVAVDFAASATGIDMTASGLGIALAAGDYWVGLTPQLDFGTFGQEFHFQSNTANGEVGHARNPGGGFGVGTDWFNADAVFSGGPGADYALRITGVPTPGAASLLAIAGIGAARRRR